MNRMKQLISDLKRRKILLPLVTAFALVVHLAGIFLLQGMKVHFESSQRAWFETHMAEPAVSDIVQKKDLQRKEDLEVIFKQLVEKSDVLNQMEEVSRLSELEKGLDSPSLEELITDFKQEGMEGQESLADIVYDLPSIPLETQARDDVVVSAIDLSDTDSLFLLAPEENQITEQLIQATSILQGDLLVEDIESISMAEGLKVGLDESASLEGTALQNRSGILEDGMDGDLQNAYPEILASLQGKGFQEGSLKEEIARANHKASPLSSETLEQTQELLRYDVTEVEDEELADGMASVASSDDFDVHLMYSPRSDKQGYVFKLAFTPKEAAKIKRIRQNMYFLLDRSHSIDKERYEYSRHAILQAISLMNPGDTFNILVFDDQVVKLGEENLSWSEENIAKARDFLLKQEHGGFFAATDIYASLGKIVPEVVASNEVNTAILLSDGDTYLRRDRQRQTIGQWTSSNAGKVSLFCVASGRGNNLPLLQLLSSFNKGVLMYSPSHDRLEPTLLKLVQSISTPIGKDMVVTAIPSNESMEITLFPRAGQLPDLYEDEPYILYGNINRLDDFYIFLQGKYYDKWLDIKQKVSFKEAKKGNSSIEKNWTVYRAYDHYYHFLSDGDFAHLGMAKRLLQPLNVQPAFQ